MAEKKWGTQLSPKESALIEKQLEQRNDGLQQCHDDYQSPDVSEGFFRTSESEIEGEQEL
jgi:hypothetical protein